MKYYDAAIIGGGPAGSFTALCLTSAGFKTALFEKKVFPREILCGEFLSYEVSNHLKDRGLFDKFLSLDPNKITSFGLYTSSGKKITAQLKFTAFGLKRSVFDKFLLDEAGSRGTEIFQPCEAEFIEPADGGYIIKTAGQGPEINASAVIGAYGKRNILDKKLGREFIDVSSPFNGVKIHIDRGLLNRFDFREIQIYTGINIYCGVNAVNGGLVTLCFLEKREKNDLPVKEKLLLLRKQNKFFNELLAPQADEAIMDAKVYGTGSIYFGKKTPVTNNIFMTGDAAGIIAPLAGDGIGMAMESAAIISGLLHKNLMNSRQMNLAYERNWEKTFRRRIFIAKMIQKALFSGILLEGGLKLLKLRPGLINTIIDYTRK